MHKTTDKSAGKPEQAIFMGLIYPTGDGWSFDLPFEFTFSNGPQTQLFIKEGKFTAIAFGQIADGPTFVNELTSVIQGLLDSLGFHLGLSMRAEILTGFVSPNRVIFTLRHKWPEAVGRSESDELKVDDITLTPFTKAAIENPLVRFALNDICTAISQPDDSAFYSYRAIESVRQWFQGEPPKTDSDSKGWERLRTALGSEKKDLKKLKNLADRRRHGAADKPITEKERLWSIGIARSVVGDFVTVYLQQKGSKP